MRSQTILKMTWLSVCKSVVAIHVVSRSANAKKLMVRSPPRAGGGPRRCFESTPIG